MNKREMLAYYKEHYNDFNDNYRKIDNAILPLVEYLRKQGFFTFASCSSHIFDYEGNPILCGQAYVSFLFADEDYEKFLAFKNHKFPKSKYYGIDINTLGDIPNKAYIDIFFNTRYNRIFHLKRIYRSLGINVNKKLTLEPEREILGTTHNPKFTIYKEGAN